MSNTAPSTYVVFEWLVNPPSTITSHSLSKLLLTLRYRLHGPWNPEALFESLLFTIRFKPLGQFPPQPAIQLGWPYDTVWANDSAIIHYDDV
jgi:hypothetical protein